MQNSKKNFTLIELLVVITIIAVLASILMPVMNYAREFARKAACLNNQAQIVRIILAYANESNKDLTGITENYRQWYAKLIIANGGKYNMANISSSSGTGSVDNEKTDLMNDALSIGTRKIFRCPADFTKGTVSYARNDAAGGWTLKKYDGFDKPRLCNSRLSVLRRPSNLIITAERWSDTHLPGKTQDQETTNAFHLRTWRDKGGDNTVDDYSSRHRGTAPIAYIDGHVTAGPFLNTVQGKLMSNVKGWWETANGHWSDDPELKN